MSDIAPAPLLKPFVDENTNLASREYGQWFSTVGNGLSGRWLMSKRNLEKTNGTAPNIEYISYQGRELKFLFVWESGVTFAADTITLDRSDLTMLPGMLEVWDDSTLVGGAYCNERTIELPNTVVSGRCIIQGTVLTKIAAQN
jgi:hypothetical protein